MKIHTILLSLLLAFSLSWAQEIIENPEKSLSENAGRVLELREEIRITDDGNEFFFKNPYKVLIANNSCIFISDREMILKFSEDGKFIINLFKKGQGPGEIEGSFHLILMDDNIYIYNRTRLKIIQRDLEGNLIQEYKLNLHSALS